MMKFIVKTCVIGFMMWTSAVAQESARPAYGIFGHYALNMHSASFQSLPEAFTCGSDYTSGSAGNIAFGGLYEFPFLKTFQLALRAGYISNGVTLRASETQLLGIAGAAQPTELEKSLAVNMAAITFEPIIHYNLFKNFNLLAGASFGYIIQKDYTQEELIVTPGKTVFIENGKRVRNESTGEIANISSLQAGLSGGLSYDMPLNSLKTVVASPEVLYSFGLTSFVSGIDWKGNFLKAGVVLKYSPINEIPPVPEIPPPAEPTITAPKLPLLTANIEAVGVTENGVEIPLASVVAEEFLRKQSQPLLPYIFFADNSAEIPDRYIRKTTAEATGFTVEQLQSSQTLEAYYEILNIVGRRMQQNPSASITLSGCNSNTDSEKGNIRLSKQRAEGVKNYLVNVWNIPTSKISIQSLNLPKTPSNSDETDGIEENRRVEISASSPDILAPIILNDTLRVIEPPLIRFKTSVQSEAGISQWNIQLTGESAKVLKEFQNVNSVIESKEIESIALVRNFTAENNIVDYSAKITDITGQKMQTPALSFPVELRSIENKRRRNNAKEIESYNLVLFEFNQAALSPENERITQMIKNSIKPNSSVVITGFTDRFGSEDYNVKLSEQRARNVAGLLDVNNATVRGLGESVKLYDNNLPEGRFYSRTINITVETEIK